MFKNMGSFRETLCTVSGISKSEIRIEQIDHLCNSIPILAA